MTYETTENNVHIYDSWTVSKNSMETWLCIIRAKSPRCLVFYHRSECSMKQEWRAHNLAYRLHFMRERTKDVDLNWPQPWWAKVAYAVVGTLAYPFIK